MSRPSAAASRAASAGEAGTTSSSSGKSGSGAHQRARPGEHQLRQDELPLHRRDGRRQLCGLAVRAGSASSSSISPSVRIFGRSSGRPRRRGSSRGWRARRGGSADRASRRRARRDRARRSPAISRPSRSAPTSVSRNGAPAGIVKTLRRVAIVLRRRSRRSRSSAAASAAGVSTLIQSPVEPHAEQPAGLDGAVEEQVQRERRRPAHRRRAADARIAAPA